MSDWMDEMASYVVPAIMDAKKELPEGGTKTMKCPKCQGKLAVVVSRVNKHCHGRCKTKDCLSWME